MVVVLRVTLNHRASLTTATFCENFSLCAESFICCTHLGYNHTIGNIMKSNDSDWSKSFTHIEHRAGAIGREGLVPAKFQSSLLNIYFRLSGPSCRSYLFTSATARISITLQQNVAQKLSDMSRSTFEIRAVQLRIAKRSPFFGV